MVSSALRLMAFSLLVCASVAQFTVVNIAGLGSVQGLDEPRGLTFLGVPYAQPPVGELRWAAPKMVEPWSGTLNGTVWGPGCPQHCDLPPLTCPITGISENCLTIDIYTPHASAGSNLPVMVFFPGGHFEQGASGTPLYNGLYGANNSHVVTVVANYRLGALGFAMSEDGSISGNYGFMDQQMVLKWVSKYISSFGGDANHVTIYGQSAGGTSIGTHLTAPSSWGLYNAVIMESNPISLGLRTPSEMQRTSNVFAQQMGCSSANNITCMRSKSVLEILQAQQTAQGKFYPEHVMIVFYPWTPVVDGKLVPMQPQDAFESGNYNPVPIMLGTVQDEGVIFMYQAFPKPLPEKEFTDFVNLIFGANASTVLDMYPIPEHMMNDTRPLLSAICTDYVFTCVNRWSARQMLQHNPSVPVYLYHYNHIFSHPLSWGPDYPECYTEVCHGSELPFAFWSAPLANYDWGPHEELLANETARHWGNFGATYNPNTPLLTGIQWPLYNVSANLNILLSAPSTIEKDYHNQYCNMWDLLGYSYSQ